MADTTSSPEHDPVKESRFFGRSKWKGKLFSSENVFGKSADAQESNDSDVAIFLQSGGPNDTAIVPRPLTAPRIDTSKLSRWPPATADFGPAPPENIYHRARPRQNKGLQVKFVPRAPEIIGVGGDEADAPVIQISQNKQLTDMATSFSQVALKRTPTGHPEFSRDRQVALPNGSLSQEQCILSTDSPEPHGQFSQPLRGSGDPSSDYPRLEVGSPVSPISMNSEDGEPDTTEEASKISPPSSLSRLPMSTDVETPRNSLTPRAPPESTARLERGSSLEHDFDGGRDGEQIPPSRTPRETAASGSEIKRKPTTFRNTVRNLGVDALQDFDSRVRRFNDIFRLGVTVHQDPANVSVSRWVRTATWWFLRGRGELESAVRSRPRSAGIEGPSEPLENTLELKQAYVDLAKAWWIINDVMPNHPHVRHFGNASMQSLLPIVQNLGNKHLAQLIEIDLSLVANMRALTMSMKRNGRLPPETIEIQKLDVLVLLELPILPPESAAALLARCGDSRRGAVESIMPMGDTESHFIFSRTFGTASLVSQQNSQDAIPMPCMVSILRAKDSFELSASIASQDGSLEALIAPEKSRDSGLTWKDVHWGKSAFVVDISGGIELSIELATPDAKALWNICDYTRKIQKDSQGREGEDLLFEGRLHYFQCLQSLQHANSFSVDPVKGCTVRLFGKTKKALDGTSHRRILVGYRLMIITAPQAKSLSSLSQEYGEGMPTVIGFGRRDGEPKLAIRVPNSSQLLLTFEAWENLDLFYNIFTQRQPTNDESRSPSLKLQDFHLCLCLSEDQFSHQTSARPPRHDWQQVKVISQGGPNHHQTSTLLERSQSLRIIAHCQQGVLTDRLNLGEQACANTDVEADIFSAWRTPDSFECP